MGCTGSSDTQQRFDETLTAINEQLKVVFPKLFEGGMAKLVLTEPDKPLESGVEYMIQPPGGHRVYFFNFPDQAGIVLFSGRNRCPPGRSQCPPV